MLYAIPIFVQITCPPPHGGLPSGHGRVSDVDEQELIAAVVSHQLMSLINTEEAAAAFILIFLDKQ